MSCDRFGTTIADVINWGLFYVLQLLSRPPRSAMVTAALQVVVTGLSNISGGGEFVCTREGAQIVAVVRRSSVGRPPRPLGQRHRKVHVM